MGAELVRYSEPIDELNVSGFRGLDDLSGTFDDLGQLIALMRDLTKSLVPLAEDLDKTITVLPDKLANFFKENQALMVGGVAGIALIGTYIVSGVVRNILEIKNNIKK